MRVVEASDKHLNKILERILREPHLYAFIIHDIRRQRDKSKFYVALSNGEVEGFILDFREDNEIVLDVYPFKNEVAKILLEYVKENYNEALVFIDRAYEVLLDEVIKLEFKRYFYSMSVKPESFKSFKLPGCKFIRVKCETKSIPRDWEYVKERITELVECYVMKHDNLLVAFGGYRVMEPEVYMLGSIYVDEKYRGRGYGKTITSFLVEKAFEKLINVNH